VSGTRERLELVQVLCWIGELDRLCGRSGSRGRSCQLDREVSV